jgi:hypothetical protein
MTAVTKVTESTSAAARFVINTDYNYVKHARHPVAAE